MSMLRRTQETLEIAN